MKKAFFKGLVLSFILVLSSISFAKPTSNDGVTAKDLFGYEPAVTKAKKENAVSTKDVKVERSVWEKMPDELKSKFSADQIIDNVSEISDGSFAIPMTKIRIQDKYFTFKTEDVKEGWSKDIEGKWFWLHFTDNGEIAGYSDIWKEIDGAYYYFSHYGYILTNTTTPDGYKVGADGKYIAETKSTLNQNVANNSNSNLASQVARAKCVTEYSNSTIVEQMDTVTFGSYPQSDVSGNTKEPIEWIVLEKNNNEVLLLSKYILDCKRYNEEQKDVTWETCTLRKWLNNTFYNTAFSNDEKKSIIKSYVENKDNSKYGTLGGNDTNDYVYSLSIDECRKYFGNEDENDCNKRLATKGTEYAKNVDNDGDRLYVSDDNEWFVGNGYFWLRSSGDRQDGAVDVDNTGYIFIYDSRGDYTNIGLRPLIRVNYK